MRMHVFMRSAALFALLASPLVALAQFAQFQQPTQDELKMTEDPKAPGAAAVYLNLEQNSDDNLGSRNFYARIKVLTEKGKSLATVEIPYVGDYKISSIKARTIHPDGTIIPLEGKPEDLLTAKSGDLKFGKKVFTLPSVEVGSILEYRYDVNYPENSVSSPMWEIQRDYFIHKAHYSFTPFKAFLKGTQNETSRYITNEKGDALNNLIWWSNLPPGDKVNSDAVGRFSIDVTDIPPQPDEDWMPPINSVLYKVFFYYKGSWTAQQYWQDTAKQWVKDVDHFADPKPFKSIVSSLVAPTDTEMQKAKKLYDAVQALDNTDFTRKKTESEMKQLKIKEAKKAEDTWNQKAGSGDDIAMVYLAMLRAAGLNAYAMRVVDRSRAIFDATYLYADQFDDTMVILTTDGKDILLDPGQKMCPFQTVSWRHSLAGGMRQMPNGQSGYVETPDEDYRTNVESRTGDITVDDHGGITGNINYVFTGQQALYWRQEALRNDSSEVNKNFDRQLEREVPDGAEAHIDHFVGLDAPDGNLVAVVKVTGSIGTATAKRMLLPGFFFESRSSEPFVKQEKRQTPVDMHFPSRVSDQIAYHLPSGMTVEGGPADNTVTWPEHAMYLVKTKSDPGTFIVARSVAHAFTMAKPEEYQDLRGFYQKIATGDQQQLVLRSATDSKAE